MVSKPTEVKSTTGLGAILKLSADKRRPTCGTRAFTVHKASVHADPVKIDGSANVTIDIWGDAVKAAVEAALGNGGATFPREAGERSADGQEIQTQQLLTSCSTAPRRWALLDKVQFLCRPVDTDEQGPSVCGCGYPADTSDTINVHLRPGDDGRSRAGVSGVYRCKSPWLWPVCAPAAAKTRAERVGRAVEACYGRGGHIALVVLTASHTLKTSLVDGKKLIAHASRRSRQGRAWKAVVEKHQVLGVVVGQEVTLSRESGWHFHQHLLVFSSGSADDAQAAADILTARYMSEIRLAGGRISGRHGVHVEIAADAKAAGEYCSKGSMAWEVCGGTTKTDTRSGGSLTPWDIANAAFDGDRWARARWSEYAEVMPGTRSCVVTPGLRKALGLSADVDDEADGEQQHHEADEVVGRLPSATWRSLLKGHLAGTFLARVEAVGEVGFDSAAQWAEERVAEAKAKMEEAKARREHSKACFEAADRERRRNAAIEAEARRLISLEAQPGRGRTIDSVRLAAENVAAAHPDVESPSAAEVLATVERIRGRQPTTA